MYGSLRQAVRGPSLKILEILGSAPSKVLFPLVTGGTLSVLRESLKVLPFPLGNGRDAERPSRAPQSPFVSPW